MTKQSKLPRAIVLHPEDNVATMIDNGPAKGRVQIIGEGEGSAELATDIPFGHKFATRRIAKGSQIRKYGQVIGKATGDIEPGGHVHIQNVEALRGRGDI